MNTPLVSVCVPNLNTFPYLQERVDTILGQTYSNWEMIVVDSFSDDGSWEFFEKLARTDSRVLISQAPRGLYAAWNNCINQAGGKYVCIATSDDTMAPDYLEKMVAALEEHEDCDVAHCPLVIIDKDGAPVVGRKWPDNTAFAAGSSELLKRRHVRRAPYDGLLHLTGRMVYRSITELLIRRSLFSRIGGFETKWGSIGDLNWDMKAGLVSNTVHVPDTWASWRVYPDQETALVDFVSVDHEVKVAEMVEEAVLSCEPYLAPEVVAGLKAYWLKRSTDMRSYYKGLRRRPGFFERKLFQLSQAKNKSVCAELIQRAVGNSKWPERAPAEIRRWLESLGLGPVLVYES